MTRTEARRTSCRDPQLAICVAIESADLLTSVKFYLSADDAKRLVEQIEAALKGDQA